MKPGQKVRIDVEGKTGKALVNGMYSYHGKIVTIQKGTDTYRMREIPYRWHPSFLQPLYPDGFRIKRKGKALDKAIVERAQELGFIPTPGLRDLSSGHSGGYIIFSPNKFLGSDNFGYWEGECAVNLPEVTLDEFFSDDFPTYDELTGKDDVLGYIDEYAVERIDTYYCRVNGIKIYAGIVQDLRDHIKTLERLYDETVTLTVGCQKVTLGHLKQILEAWDE